MHVPLSTIFVKHTVNSNQYTFQKLFHLTLHTPSVCSYIISTTSNLTPTILSFVSFLHVIKVVLFLGHFKRYITFSYSP